LPNFQQLLKCVVLVCAAMMFTGCLTHSVGFNTNAPYAPAYTRSGWVAVTYPEGLADEVYTVRTSDSFLSKRFKTYWGGAVTAQASARFSRVFEGGVLLISEADATEIERLVKAARAEVPSPTDNPNRWKEAVRKAAGMTDPLEIPTNLVRNAEDPPTYIIRILNPTFSAPETKPLYAMDVRVIEPLSTAILLDAHYSVAGRKIRPKNDTNMMIAELREVVSETINGAMIQLATGLEEETRP
jgi:hypothetical protein